VSGSPTPRRGSRTIAANPVLIGAVTVLVAVVAVFLSYNANNGLPFVPSYQVSAVVPDAAELVPGNDVRLGGSRVGSISQIRAVRTAHGAHAVIDIKIAERDGPLPADTRLVVRQRSSLGLKYLEVLPGRSRRTVPDGGRLANPDQTPAVDLDDVLDSFAAPTRTGISELLTGFGAGLAGRGGDLNRGLDDLPDALGPLARVAANLASPRTDLAGFLAATAATVRGIAPVAPQMGAFASAAATTFAALDDRPALRATLERAAATIGPDTRDLAATVPALADADRLLRALRPGARRLAGSASRLAASLGAVTRPLARTAPTLRAAGPALASVRKLAANPTTSRALRQLSGLAEALVPTLTYVNPMQTRCNYLGLWTRNVPGFLTEGDSLGTWFRAMPVVQPSEMLAQARPAPEIHVNFYPDAGQHGTCEAGTTAYVPNKQVIGPTGVRSPGHTEDTAPPTGVRGR
jgi:virulence factor Mce-like protein